MDFFRELGTSSWQLIVWRAPFGLAVTVLFAAGARLLRSVTRGGALAGACVTLALWLASPPAFAVLIAVFLLTAGATRLGYARKHRRGTAEAGDGRTASQVLANLLVATFAALLAQFAHQAVALAALAASLAEAACDTVSSEIGQAFSSRAYLITSFRRVEPGIDGGISVLGTLAGAAAALAVAAVAAAMQVIAWGWLLPVTLAAIAGMLFDSLLGATLERRRWLNNNAVNLLGTASAASLVFLSV
jgi:uncharacterized protein (TIGR00297 family)